MLRVGYYLSVIQNKAPIPICSHTDGSEQKAGQVFGIPGAENVRLIGKGYQGKDHFGLGQAFRKISWSGLVAN
jgi:hypothetical protein